MVDRASILDVNPPQRTEAEWRGVLEHLVSELIETTGVGFQATSWYTESDREGHESSSNCVNVRGTVSDVLRLAACGVVCVSVNFGESVGVSADLLLFSDGARVLGPDGKEMVSMLYDGRGWRSQGWRRDGNGEWESHTTDARWRGASA
ncbi:MAG: hypothetical protein R3B72_08840 [Polyangiaceae bacterium]